MLVPKALFGCEAKRELLRLGNGVEQVHGKIRAAVQKALAHG